VPFAFGSTLLTYWSRALRETLRRDPGRNHHIAVAEQHLRMAGFAKSIRRSCRTLGRNPRAGRQKGGQRRRLASATDCTMILLTSTSDPSSAPQLAMVDGMIQLRSGSTRFAVNVAWWCRSSAAAGSWKASMPTHQAATGSPFSRGSRPTSACRRGARHLVGPGYRAVLLRST
jgi:hypothetical protein